jgi:hypothetical protein
VTATPSPSFVLRLDAATLERLREAAREEHVTLAEVLRRAVGSYLVSKRLDERSSVN